MKLFARLFRLVWGGDIDRALRPVLAVGLVGSIAGSSAYPFMGIWAIKELHASEVTLSLAYLVGAAAAGFSGYLGGHLSDRLGRRPLILAGWGGQALCAPAALLVGHRVWPGLAILALLPVLNSLGGAADQAMVADLVPPERHEASYASVRVANNLGVTIGPPIGGLLLLGGHWSHLWLGTFLLALGGFAIAFRFVPRRGRYAPEEPPERSSLGAILRDHPFLLFMASSTLATMTYFAYETLLPISLTTSHGVSPTLWGALVIVNPIFVAFLQLRLTRAVAHIRASVKLALAMPLMGVPFVLLNATSAIPVVLFVIVLFVIGEMLWVPTAQTVVAAFAPADIRGAYMGVFSGTFSVGLALTPFLGLQARHAWGDATMWVCVAGVGVLAGVLGLVAARGHDEAAAVASASA